MPEPAPHPVQRRVKQSLPVPLLVLGLGGIPAGIDRVWTGQDRWTVIAALAAGLALVTGLMLLIIHPLPLDSSWPPGGPPHRLRDALLGGLLLGIAAGIGLALTPALATGSEAACMGLGIGAWTAATGYLLPLPPLSADRGSRAAERREP